MSALNVAALLVAALPVHVVPMQAPRSSMAPAASNGQPPACGGGTCDLRYWGGHVISNVKIYALFWGAGVNATTRSGVGGFFTALTNSEWMDWQNEYRTDIVPAGGGTGTGQLIGRGTFAGPAITIAPSQSATCSGTSQANPLDDLAIQSELARQIQAGSIPPPDANTLYMIYFPPACVIGSGTSRSCVDFCAYHGTLILAGRNVFYGVVPDFGAGSGCDVGCGGGTLFQNTCAASSHEVGEAMTDAEVGLASALAPPLAWYDSNNGEDGDMCNHTTATIASVVDGAPYTVQQMYSAKSGLCQATRTDANDFRVFMNPNAATVAAGGTVAVPVQTVVTAGSPAALHLTLGPLPAGVTGSFDATTLDAGQTATLTLSAASAASSVRDAVVVVTACAGAGTCPSPGVPAHTASLLLQVTGASTSPEDFSVAVTPAAATALAPGRSIRYDVATSVTSGAGEPVNLGVTGLPPGVTGSFGASPIAGGTATTLTLAASAGATPSAPTTFTVTGASASVPAGRSATSQVQVDGLPSLVLSVPATFSSVVHLSATAAAGAGTTLASLAVFLDGEQIGSGPGPTLNVDLDTTLYRNGAHALAGTATDADGGSASKQAAVSLTNDFTLGITPALPTATIGHSPAAFTVSTLAAGGAAPVSLAVTGLPAGVQGSFDPPTVIAGASSTLTILAPAGIAPARATFTVTATTRSVPAGHQVRSDVLLVRGPSASIFTPAGQTVSGTVTINATATADANAGGVVRIDVKDGDRVIGTGTAETLSVSWDTTLVPNGTHALSAVAVDGLGNSATSPGVSVVVSNSSGGGCATGGVDFLGGLAVAALFAVPRRRRSGRLPRG